MPGEWCVQFDAEGRPISVEPTPCDELDCDCKFFGFPPFGFLSTPFLTLRSHHHVHHAPHVYALHVYAPHVYLAAAAGVGGLGGLPIGHFGFGPLGRPCLGGHTPPGALLQGQGQGCGQEVGRLAASARPLGQPSWQGGPSRPWAGSRADPIRATSHPQTDVGPHLGEDEDPPADQGGEDPARPFWHRATIRQPRHQPLCRPYHAGLSSSTNFASSSVPPLANGANGAHQDQGAHQHSGLEAVPSPSPSFQPRRAGYLDRGASGPSPWTAMLTVPPKQFLYLLTILTHKVIVPRPFRCNFFVFSKFSITTIPPPLHFLYLLTILTHKVINVCSCYSSVFLFCRLLKDPRSIIK